MASKADEVTRPRTLKRAAEWVTHRERGSLTLLRIMSFLSLRLGRRGSRPFLHVIAIYFFLFAPTVRRHAIAYFRRVLGRDPTRAERYRHVLAFATTIHDRVYLLTERYELLDISIEGEDLVQQALNSGQGAFLMGSHVGSFEVIRSVGRRKPGLRVAIAMYEDNARQVNAMLTAVSSKASTDVIRLGHINAMLKIQEYLDRGTWVGVLGDRTLGNEASVRVNFLGDPARFPVGAMRAAAILRRPVIFMIGLYRGGNRYHVAFEQLADFSAIESRQREAAVQAAVERYAALLEKHVRSDPYNWFNFFDFWRGGDE